MNATETRERSQAGPIGKLLREWRSARGFSQLDLAMRAGFSSRHLSFIETGRTQPSRQALLILAETLEVPLRERNRLLEAGGYAHIYRQTPLDADDMRHVRGVLQFILDRHEPYGAVVLDRYSNLLMGNAAATRLLGGLVDRSLLTASPNLLRMVFHPQGGRRHVVNWNEVSHHLLTRAERELGGPGDETAAALLRELRAYAGPTEHEPPTAPHPARGRAAAGPHSKGRTRSAPVQRDHDARDAAGRHAPGAEDRDVFPGRRADRAASPAGRVTLAGPAGHRMVTWRCRQFLRPTHARSSGRCATNSSP